MTEPDEALLWARVEYATMLRPFDVGPQQDYISEAILNGLWDDDVAIRHSVIGYRAGAAASAERIKELEGKVTGLTMALCQFLDVVTNDGHDGSHLADDDGGQSECEVCAVMAAIRVMAGIRVMVKDPDQ